MERALVLVAEEQPGAAGREAQSAHSPQRSKGLSVGRGVSEGGQYLATNGLACRRIPRDHRARPRLRPVVGIEWDADRDELLAVAVEAQRVNGGIVAIESAQLFPVGSVPEDDAEAAS